MHIFVERVAAEELTDDKQAESSEAIAKRVAKARNIQLERYKGEEGVFTNSRMSTEMLTKYCSIRSAERDFLQKLIEKLQLSARAYSRVLKLARTIADLAGEKDINRAFISEAVQYRSLDRHEK